MSYSTPTSLSGCDMANNDDIFHMNYTNQVDSIPELDFGVSSCLPSTGGEPAFAYSTYDGLPWCPNFSSLPSTSSSSVASSLATDDSSPQPIIESETEEREGRPAAKQVGKRKRRGDSVGRTGDKPKRRVTRTNTGSSKIFSRLPPELQQALETRYDCCKAVNKQDTSALHKHWLSNRHFNTAVGNLEGLLDTQPAYICPAFISMHDLCKFAKAGRPDAANRHCGPCEGLEQIRAKCDKLKLGTQVIPFEVQRGEYEAVKAFRKRGLPDQESYPEPLLNAVFKLLAMMATGKPVLNSTSTDSKTPSLSDEEPTMRTMLSSGKSEVDGDDNVNGDWHQFWEEFAMSSGM